MSYLDILNEYSVSEIREALYHAESPKGKKIVYADDLYEVLRPYGAEKQEFFIVVTLNTEHEIINIHEVTKGLLNRTMVHPREVFRPALFDNAYAIMIAHNHPSGKKYPSEEDKEITLRLKKAAEIVDIKILDHLIIAADGFFSFSAEQ